MNVKPRIAWFSALDSRSDSLACYTTRAVMPYLHDHFEMVVFTDPTHGDNSAIIKDHYLNAHRRHLEKPFDLFVYNIEDAPSSRFARAHLGLIPGVVWLHHAALSDLGAEAYHSSPWEYTIDRFLDLTAPFNRRGNPVHPLWPLAYRERSLATLLLCSSRLGLHQLTPLSGRRLEAYPGGHQLEYLPVPTILDGDPPAFPPRSPLTIAAAARSGIAGEMHKVFLALQRFSGAWRLSWMVDEDEVAAARALVAEFMAQDCTTIISGRTPETWRSLVAQSSIAIHLHNSPFESVSPYLELSLGAGRPVIVSGYPGISEVSDQAAFRIEPGLTMAAQLSALLNDLQAMEPSTTGLAGRTYAQCELAPEAVSRRLTDLLRNHIPVWREILRRWNEIGAAAENALEVETTRLVTPGGEDLIDAGAFVDRFFAEFAPRRTP